ncbi:MAG: hypothetical protein JNJ46_23655 [Myxococcales bacterium]|nr:hypothetical protein [Myxococcales bacterium]
MYKLAAFEQWRGVIKAFRFYWNAYGGLGAFFSSPYCHIALVITVITKNYWLSNCWFDQALSIVPSLLGFTLAAYTIILTIGNDQFRRILASIFYPENSSPPKTEKTDSPSVLMVNSTVFFHVLFIQMITTVSSVLCKEYRLSTHIVDQVKGPFPVAWWSITMHGIAYFFYILSLLLILAACVCVFRLSQSIDDFLRFEAEKDELEKRH